MADFRRWFMAFAVVTMLTGLAVSANAQLAPAFQCVANAGVPPIIRGEGYTELVGDVTLNCTGGVPTTAGQPVPQVNFQIFLNTNATSRILAGGIFSEALLIFDEPNSAANPNRPILNCGNAGAPDNGPSGPGVCLTTSTGNPADTYDGTVGGTTYGSGRPNVFQGRLAPVQNVGQQNSITWLGVPLDPPGTTTNRTIRITNVRANAVSLGVSSTFITSQVQMNISVSGNTSLAINNPSQIVAFVQRGLAADSGVRVTNFGFLQCIDENLPLFGASSGSPFPGTFFNSPQPAIRFIEGFAQAWKVKNLAHALANSTYSGTTNSYAYNGGTNYPTPDTVQNVPGAIYNTESGFEFAAGQTIPSPNPPPGFGTTSVNANIYALDSTAQGGLDTNIHLAGFANAGTRLAISFTDIPNGTQVFVPSVVGIFRQGTAFSYSSLANASGVAVLTTTAADGSGAYSRASTGGQSTLVRVTTLAVYEVLYADVFSLEYMDVPVVVAYDSNLPNNLPVSGQFAKAAVGFAPFSTAASWGLPSSSLPIPRFFPGAGPKDLFLIVKCACNLLFPYAVAQAGYDTGLAIANTSLDPGSQFGFFATPQAGKVTLWYFGEMASGGSPPPPQTTFGNVAPGNVLTYVLSSGNADTRYRLDNRGNGLLGYIITQSEFQWCHGFAFITALGAGPTSPQASQGYLGLVLDFGGLFRTNQFGEVLGH